MTSTTRSLTFREEGGGARFTISTVHPLYNEGSGVVVQITQAGEKFPMGELDRYEVEELHQFTYDLLAGPAHDPRLDRVANVDGRLYCGEFVTRPNSGRLECCLYSGHSRVGNFDHVTADGELFDTPGF